MCSFVQYEIFNIPSKHDLFHVSYLELIKITYIALNMKNTMKNTCMCCCFSENREGVFYIIN